MEKALGNDGGLERPDSTALLEKQLRALATLYKVLEMPHNLLSQILVQQEAQTKWLIHIGEQDGDKKSVKVEDINMPFWALVGFLAKVAFASIPAAIIFYIFTGIAVAIFLGILGIGTGLGG